MPTVLESLASREAAKRETASADFAVLVEQIAGGKNPDLKRAEAVLTAAGKTPADLAAEVARQQRVAELERTIAGQTAAADEASAEMEREASRRDGLERAYRESYERFSASTSSFTAALGLRQLAHDRRAAAEKELRQLREPAA